jgi:phosphomannomutase/phosphoglucomutase
MMNPHIFREYDIRGLVDKDLTPEVVELLGKGFGTYLQRNTQGRVVTVGYDIRLSSPEFCRAICKGIASTGCNVINIGLSATPLLYYSLFELNPDGGVMITGSHNPPEFNGFKLCMGKTTLYGEQIQQVRQIIEDQDFIAGVGQISEADVIASYINLLKNKIKLGRKLKVVIDCGNGSAGIVAPQLIKELGCELVELYCEPDGHFPNHHPDPTVPKFIADLIATVKQEQADVGIAYDGDADRIGVVDEQGNILWGDQLMILYSRDILAHRPGATIIYEVKCSQNLGQDVSRHGGKPIMWKTGHSLIKQKMKEEGAALAGEMSGHMFFADDYFGYDDAVYASCRLLQLLSHTDQPLSQMLADVPKTYSTPEIRVECADEDKFHIIEEIMSYFKERYEVIDVDGVRIVFPDGWGLVRASNTQPVLVLRFEAGSETGLSEIKQTVLNKLAEYPAVSLKDI